MVDLPEEDFFTSTTHSNLEAKQALDDTIAFARSRPGGAALTALTISGGVITPTAGSHAVDTEAAASTDTLTNAETTNLVNGSLLLLCANNASRTVTLQNAAGGSGQFRTATGADYTMSTTKWILLINIGADWYEVFRTA